MTSETDIVLMLGRLEGKVDALVTLQGTTVQRSDNLETRQSATEKQVSAMEASQENNSGWLTHIASFAALAVAIAGFWMH